MFQNQVRLMLAKLVQAREIRLEELKRNPDSQFLLGSYAQIEACILMIDDILEDQD